MDTPQPLDAQQAVSCPHCQHDNPAGTVICAYCGEVIDQAALRRRQETPSLGDHARDEARVQWGTGRFDQRTTLNMHVIEDGKSMAQFSIDVRQPDGVILGRCEPEPDTCDWVDLTPYDAVAHGVSREHARLTLSIESLFITDLGSKNGTYLNGSQIGSGNSRLLRNGDSIQLGRLRLEVHFAKPPTA